MAEGLEVLRRLVGPSTPPSPNPRFVFGHQLPAGISPHTVPSVPETPRLLGYRGNLFYDLCKVAAIRLAYAMAADVRDHTGITALALTPAFLRSEAMLDHFGVAEANWEDAVKKDRHFAESETPFFVGRAVAALAADPDVHARNGRVFASWTLAKEYGFRDIDGRQPDFGGYFQKETAGILDHGGPADAHERFQLLMRYYQVQLDPARTAETARIPAPLRLSTAAEDHATHQGSSATPQA